jgi:DNA replication protein DnaC
MFSASSLARDFNRDRPTSSSLIRISIIGRSSITVQLARHLGSSFRYRQVNELHEARDEKRLQRQLAGLKLLIVDELGYVPLSQTGA